MLRPFSSTSIGVWTRNARCPRQPVTIHYLDQGKGESVIFYYRLAGCVLQLRAALPATYRAIHFDDPVAEHFLLHLQPSRLVKAIPSRRRLMDQLAGLLMLELDGLRTQLGFTSAHFVTHSFGGLIAQQAALRRPDLFHDLVLDEPMGPASMFDDPAVELPPTGAEQCALQDAETPWYGVHDVLGPARCGR